MSFIGLKMIYFENLIQIPELNSRPQHCIIVGSEHWLHTSESQQMQEAIRHEAIHLLPYE